MKLGLSSLLFVRNTIEEAIRINSELGAECVEIIYDVPHFPPNYDLRKLASIKELLESYGLGVSVHGSFWDLNPASHHRKLWELSLEQMRKSIDACRMLGGEITVVHFGKCPVPEALELLKGSKERYREFITQCLVYARDRGVTIGFENAGRDPRSYPSDVEELKFLLYDLEGAKMTFDVGHAHLAARRAGGKATGFVIAGQIKEMRKHIAHVHLHDNHGKTDDHLPPGDGEIDFRPIVDAIKDIGYNGLLIAELWNPKKIFETGKRGLEKLKRLFRIT